MSSYIVLARKWRPTQFSDVVGQIPIVKTLNNAIRDQRIHQAYLFTGSRGVGKTSIARIFSKVIRCENRSTLEGWLISCDQCSSCLEIKNAQGVDVLEIDGASNNGVEAIREIRENVQYLPSHGKQKIYIIDEVHMLTTPAFNALLKTLEEPPPHVIFILATTEPHKIPVTILSRCQRLDFRRVSVPQIVSRLVQISSSEGLEAEEAALSLVAQSADGSMRDALSLLDQVIAYAGNKIQVADVRESLGLIENQMLLAIVQAVFQRQPLEAIQWIEKAHEQGQDLRVLTRGLIQLLHDCILIQVGHPYSSTSHLSEEDWKQLEVISKYRSLEEAELIFQVLSHGLESIARSTQPKSILEVLVIKSATAQALVYCNQDSPSAPPSPAHLPAVTEKKSGEGLIEHVRSSRPLLATLLEHASHFQIPETSTDHTVLVCFTTEENYYREQLLSRTYQEQLLNLAKEYFGRAIRLQIDMKDSGESVAAKKIRLQNEKMISLRREAEEHPIILEAKSLFGGNMSPIEIHEGRHAD